MASNRSGRTVGATTVLVLVLMNVTPALSQAVGTCETGQAEAYLDVNNVRARIFNNGALFWRGDPPVYEVPMFGGPNALFANGIWIGGVVDGSLRFAGSTYGPYEYWPGPLEADGSLPDQDDCSTFDRIYEITAAEIDEYERTGYVSENLAGWPHELGAPVKDGDGDPSNYDLEAGDMPATSGHQMLWWVMNDLGNTHDRTEGLPLGIEVHASAYAAASEDDAINDATLYRYRLLNRQNYTIDSVYFSFWSDVELGFPWDDYVGSDTALNMIYGYNADNFDEHYPGGLYGERPPAIGIQLLRGPDASSDSVDNDNDGTIDQQGETLRLSSMVSTFKGGYPFGDPQELDDYRYYQRGLWRNGQPITVGGIGVDFSAEPTKFMFPGDPVTSSYWSQMNVDGEGTRLEPSDQRMMWSVGPFRLEAGEEASVDLAIVWARGADHLDSVDRLREAAATVRESFQEGFYNPLPPPITESPTPRSPGDRSHDQPTDVVLHWNPLTHYNAQELLVARDSAMTEIAVREKMNGAEGVYPLEGLRAGETYYWQVRALHGGRWGLPSTTFSFTTSHDSLVTPAPLTTQSGSYAWVETVAPREIDPCGEDAQSRFGCDEVGNLVWRSPNSTGEYYLSASADGGPETYIGSYSPHDFELRFSEEGSFAVHPFTSRKVMWVPFEVWEIGSVEPLSENDPSDDTRLIPALLSDGGGDCTFDMDETEDPFGSIPASDRIYAFYPLDSYDAWGAFADSLLSAQTTECGLLSDADPLPFDTTYGPPIHNLLIGDFNRDGVPPEPPTTIRFYTNNGSRTPLPASPANEAIVSDLETDLWWNGTAPNTKHRLQVAFSPEFTSLIVDTLLVNESRFRLRELEQGATYFWRMRRELPIETPWSAVWSFETSTDAATEPEVPGGAFALHPAYPNPFAERVTLRYEIQEAAHVELVVYDLLGRRVAQLVNGVQRSGTHDIEWNAHNLASGVYWCRLRSGGFEAVRAVMIVR